MESQLIQGAGGCHCKRIRFTFKSPASIKIWKCNCSICLMKQNHHFIIPHSNFILEESSSEFLTSYRFNTQKAEHLFCKICGVQSFYQPRSNPDGYAITVYCVDNYSTFFKSIEWIDYDGQNWEQQIETSNIKQESEKKEELNE